ncbi:hypothetical protein BEN47_17655 [Hymenobacter lapidarius]|uniref:Uncharacterized protein n=1 Tax=Hymenobacter lapidarius TaxID=1908237 RepID=A0A1G1SX79_9BACT|nr:hypothetical protein [Hymenobacter lapidarius]OGX83231.1 hypothetical protein BEN47_17655 [Hymenobacter lapidarius]
MATGCVRRDFFQSDARVGAGGDEPLPPATDTVLTVAGRQYNDRSKFHHLFWGRHYRKVWAAPVKAPVLHLATAVPGGLKAGKLGGGYQSISMTLEGPHKREYALRALDKEPSKTLPKVLRHTFVLNVVRDATSAAMPYGAFTVPPLARAAGVPHTRPRLVYVRLDETGLGSMSERFQGKLALLEEKFEELSSRTPELSGASGFVSSEKMLAEVYASSVHRIDQPAFLRARLLDAWLGDWDRHEGQWDWAEFKQPDGRVRYQAIPKDRDQVYFRFDDGLVPWLASRPFIAPQFHTFKRKFGYVPGLLNQAHFIDQRGLARLTRADFLRMAADLQRRLPDTLIDRAIRHLPPAVYALEGRGIIAKLEARRQTLPQFAEAYYLRLARKPVLGGTALPERFVVQRYPDSTTVQIFAAARAKLTRGDSLHFQRTYYSAETRSLTLESLGGADVFEIRGDGRNLIPLLIYGGEGADRLQLSGTSRGLKLFDVASDLQAAGAPRPTLPPTKRLTYDRTVEE